MREGLNGMAAPMLNDLYIGNVSLPAPLRNEKEWDWLLRLWADKYPSVKFSLDPVSQNGPVWHISESCDSFYFDMVRSVLDAQRLTNRNDLGCIGFSLINPQDKKVIITEGVSDYFTVKLLCPQSNVLGFTTLGGTSASKAIVVSLFDSITYCADNDEAGLSAGMKVKAFFESYGKPVNVFTAPTPYKDVTEAAMKLSVLNSI